MRNLIFSCIAILALALVVSAAAPTDNVVDAVYENGGVDTIIKNTTGLDTLAGVDSTTLISGHIFAPGWRYILVRDRITGTAADGSGTDSVALQVRVDALDGNGNLFYSTLVDSMTTVAGEAILLPITGTVFGSKIRIKLIGYTGNGGQVILNRFSIYKRRAITITRDWR